MSVLWSKDFKVELQDLNSNSQSLVTHSFQFNSQTFPQLSRPQNFQKAPAYAWKEVQIEFTPSEMKEHRERERESERERAREITFTLLI